MRQVGALAALLLCPQCSHTFLPQSYSHTFLSSPHRGTSRTSPPKPVPPHPLRTILEHSDRPRQRSVLPTPAVSCGHNRLVHRRVTTVVRVQIGRHQLVLFLVLPLRLAVAAGVQIGPNGVLDVGVEVGHSIVGGLKPGSLYNVGWRHVRPVQLSSPPLRGAQLGRRPQQGSRHLLPKVRARREAL